MAVPSFLLTHEISVEPYAGTDSSGVEHFGLPVIVQCFVDQKTRRVTGPTGAELVSGSTAYAALETVVPANSRVTLADGTVTRVIEALRRDGGGLPTPDHLEIILV